jgi:hypothetical protein
MRCPQRLTWNMKIQSLCPITSGFSVVTIRFCIEPDAPSQLGPRCIVVVMASHDTLWHQECGVCTLVQVKPERVAVVFARAVGS